MDLRKLILEKMKAQNDRLPDLVLRLHGKVPRRTLYNFLQDNRDIGSTALGYIMDALGILDSEKTIQKLNAKIEALQAEVSTGFRPEKEKREHAELYERIKWSYDRISELENEITFLKKMVSARDLARERLKARK